MIRTRWTAAAAGAAAAAAAAAAATVALLAALSCGVPRPLHRVAPEFDPLPGQPASRSGRVVLEVEDRRCRVRLASSHPTAQGATILQSDIPRARGVLCVTPCQLELPVGWHLLTFCDIAKVSVPVVRKTAVLRVRLVEGEAPHVTRWMLDASAAASAAASAPASAPAPAPSPAPPR